MEINIYNFVERHLADGTIKIISVKPISALKPKDYFINPHKPKELNQLEWANKAVAKFDNFTDFQTHMTTNVAQLVKVVELC